MRRTVDCMIVLLMIGFASRSLGQDEYGRKHALAKEWMKFFAGEWDITTTYQVGDGEVTAATESMSGKLSGSGMAVAAESKTDAGTFVQFTYWDPESRSLVTKIVGQDGLMLITNTFSRIEGDFIKGTVCGRFNDDPVAGDYVTAGTIVIRKTDKGYRLSSSSASPERPPLKTESIFTRK